MLKSYDYYLDKIKYIFEEAFLDSYKNIKGRNKRRLCMYVSDIYRKWYYSTLLEGTILTPANLVSKLNRLYKIDPITFDSIGAKIIDRKIVFSYKRLNYSSGNYHIIDDLKSLLSHCYPYIEITENLEVKNDIIKVLDNELSIKEDNYYVNYLLSLAFELGLLNFATSIHMKAAKPSKSADSFFELEPEEAFHKIVDATISILASFLESTLMAENFSKEFILSLLKKPITVNEIYEKLYSSNGVDLNLIFGDTDDYSPGLPEEIMEYINLGIYYLGIGIDKYFLTTFGYYLKLIVPMYVIPFKIAEDMAILYNTVRDNMDIDSEVYSPCSHYYLTELGLKHFDVKCEETEKFMISDEVDITEVIDTIYDSWKTSKTLFGLSMPQDMYIYDNITVYQIKVALISDRRYWITLEISDDTTLNELHNQICHTLNFLTASDYSFYLGMEESPFLQYTPETNKKRTKKAENTTLASLNLSENDVMKYVVENYTSIFSDIFGEKIVRFELRLIKIKTGEYSHLYPRIYRKSKRFLEHLGDYELDF